MIPSNDFPRLTSENHQVTSAADVGYNCIAWAARDTKHWWQPGRFWPADTAAGDFGIGILALAFKTLGYEDCDDANLEPGFEKVALYGDFSFYKHAARQLSSGAWTSKLGKDVDIEHDTPDDVAGGLYGGGRSVDETAVADASYNAYV